MLLYITLGTNDLARAMRFYDGVMPCLGLERRFANDAEAGYGEPAPTRIRLWVTQPFSLRPLGMAPWLRSAPRAGLRSTPFTPPGWRLAVPMRARPACAPMRQAFTPATCATPTATNSRRSSWTRHQPDPAHGPGFILAQILPPGIIEYNIFQ